MDLQPTECPMLRMEGICKNFGPTRALHEVKLSVHAGEVVALIGENGAGKSTLLKILSGAHQADSGSIRIDELLFHPNGPSDSRRLGIAMIYQELNLAPDLSIEDNILLGQRGTGKGLLFRSKQRNRIKSALAEVGLADLNPKAIVGQQSVATQQLVEIARALVGDSKIILFDEPTSSLPQKDVAKLFEIISRLRSRGIGVVYISHFLDEVRTIADRFTVLRDGENVGDGKITKVSDQEIVSLMVGRDVDDLFPTVDHTPGEGWVTIRQLTGTVMPRNVNLELRRGEIFGVAGLVGAGRSELMRTLFGLDYAEAGVVEVGSLKVRKTVPARMKAGFGLLSEDRKNEGLAQDLSLIENVTLSKLKDYTRFGIINLRMRKKIASQFLDQTQVKAHSIDQPISELSGGNQQKVAIARILHQRSEILLLDEPTKGIDVGTKAEIYRMMGELAANGKTIVFVSSYLPELLAVCDRIGVMARGELRDVRETADWTKEEVMEAAIAI